MSVCTQVLVDALKTVKDPELDNDLISLQMVKDLACNDAGEVSLTIVLTTPACPLKEQIESDVRRALMRVRGVKKVNIAMTAETSDGNVPVECSDEEPVGGHPMHPTPMGPGAEKIRNVIGVASGKGGVGKSTVAVNLACALAKTGARVGLLDADFHGPNIPIMMGLGGVIPEVVQRSQANGEPLDMIVPVMSEGVKVVSISFFIKDDEPVIWRGPMLHTALNQFIHQVDWGELDYLVVDMPPGTGDIQISLIQSARLTGVVHVTTPQSVSVLDVAKGVSLFKSQGIPQLGVIENMSYFVSPATHEKTFIFGQGGGSSVADKFGIPFLGEIPLEVDIRVGGDTGKPVVLSSPDSAAGKAFMSIAKCLAAAISVANIAKRSGGSPCDNA